VVTTAEALTAILGKCGRDELPKARAGVASGRVLIRGGDYFGPVVNLASRLVDVAPAGAIAVDEAFRSMLGDPKLEPEPISPQDLKGIGPTNVWLLTPES
jgi:adenylate cyclase